jgi:glutamate 5-kinase
MTKSRKTLADTRRWVIKIGSSLITNDGRGLDHAAIATWAGQIARLRESGKQIVLVSSGAVAEGMSRMGWSKRPHALHELQAAAAIGQMGLVQAYEHHFQGHGLHAAQVLLTHEDLADRRRYLNARSTLQTLLELGVIPVVNENDTVATDEIRFGDNDTLGALVANLVVADLLIILTDQQGVYDKDPRKHADAELIHEAAAEDSRLLEVAGPSGTLIGSGGMTTKITAAQRAARSGAATLIASGREPGILMRVAEGERLGTLLSPGQEPLAARKQWLASHMRAKGRLLLDAGATRVIRDSGRSLLPVGVKGIEGQFVRGDVVALVGDDGREVARGLVNYSAEEARKIIGRPSEAIESLLGYVDEHELVHRDNLVLI